MATVGPRMPSVEQILEIAAEHGLDLGESEARAY